MIIDTIHHAVQATVQTKTDNPNYDLVYYVNNFYEQAWNKLIWVVGIILGIGGVVLPILIQIWQRNKLKISKKRISESIEEAREEIDKLRDSIKAASDGLRSEISALIINTREEIDNTIKNAKEEMLNNAIDIVEQRVKTLELRAEAINVELMARGAASAGDVFMEAKNFNKACINFLLSLKHFTESDEFNHIKSVVNRLLSIPFEQLNPQRIDSFFKGQDEDIASFFQPTLNKHPDLKENIEKIMVSLKEIPR